ncbi:hypothetical protein BJ138DRAFT_1155277 [Hygrophoropsis aurantiaca]|uniref:Uncharacterized protein n=1 Tax=Hygrophoropsis aurantiaca TaxID=72124 RepID=A0ACB8A8P2_9AGAM|nr:hypothetical protein BJ138DRAFT_1155277 [Hygrophoropsis aurantiaca]
MLDREPSVSDGAQPVLGDETLLLEQQQSMLDREPPVHELGGLSITEPALKATSEDIEMISPSSPTAREVETPVSPPHIHQSKTSIPNIPISAPPHQEPAAEPSSSKEKLPLFLPSPSPSPTPSERPPKRAIDQEEIIIIDDGPPSSGSPSPQEVIMMDVDESDLPRRMAKKKREQPFYILVPPPPRDWKLGAKRRRTRQKGYSQKVQDLDHEDEVPAYSMAEQIALDESLYRVMERPCRWKNCDAIMNSGGNMLKHLELHATGSGKRASSLCGWKGCQRRFSSPTSRRTHLEGHAYYPIPCRHPGCSETFLQPVELMHHDLRFHSQSQPHNSLIRTTARPFAPTIAQSLGVVPRILPAYRVEPRHIRQIGITLQRHRVIGPQVLQNIFAPVELNLRKQNAPMRSRNSNQMGGTDDRSRSLGARPDEYDFLASLSSASSKLSALDKLDSETVSQMAATGLALFGPEPGSHSEEGVEEDIDMEDIDADLEESVVELEETQEAHGIQPGIPDNIVSVSDTEGPKDSVDAAIVEGSHGGNTVSVEMMA